MNCGDVSCREGDYLLQKTSGEVYPIEEQEFLALRDRGAGGCGASCQGVAAFPHVGVDTHPMPLTILGSGRSGLAKKFGCLVLVNWTYWGRTPVCKQLALAPIFSGMGHGVRVPDSLWPSSNNSNTKVV